MKHRFRYLDERGQQVEVTDLTSLRTHVQEGRIDGDTLLYDAMTDEWAPASAHSAYRLLDDPLAGGRALPGTAAGSPAELLASAPEPDFPDLEMTLAEDDELESSDEVVEKLLRERARDRGETQAAVLGSARSGEPRAEKEAVKPEKDPWSRVRRQASSPSEPRPAGEPGPSPRPRTQTRSPRARGTVAPRAGAGSWRKVEVPSPLVALAAVLMVLLGVYSFARILDPAGAAQASTGNEGADATVTRPSNPSWAATEGSAFRDMLAGVDSLRSVYSVQRIPEPWLSGPYLADAEDYPRIRNYWSDYLQFVDAVRSQDTALFRRSFVQRLEEQGMSGPMVSIRLARALETFRESQPARDKVYEQMEELATSALDLHELLVERSEDILYDPVTEERASRQPILEAWSDDPFLRQSIWGLLDRITANLALLEYDAGAGRSDLTERLFQQLRARSLGPEDGAAGG